MKLPVSSSPHAHAGSSVNRIMLDVCVALLPCTAMGFYLFGWPAFLLWSITIGAAIACEGVCLLLRGKSTAGILDGSALLTGWLIALTLPPWAPWWIGVSGAVFAIGIGKQLYGGVGQNIFNPAMLARVGLLIAFPVQMTTWIEPLPQSVHLAMGFSEALQITFAGQPVSDAYTGATLLGERKTALHAGASMILTTGQDDAGWPLFLGFQSGSMGETSELLILLGGLWLLTRGIISWEIPAALLGTLAFLSTLAHLIAPEQFAGPLFTLTSGGVVLGAIFIATDPVTSPISRTGKLLFGAGCALIVLVIRWWGNFPEAVGFAVLFMNALTPLLDRLFKPRVYGRSMTGKPLLAARSQVATHHRRDV